MSDNWKSVTQDAFTHFSNLVERFFVKQRNYIKAIRWRRPYDSELDLKAIDSYWNDTLLYLFKELQAANLNDEIRFFKSEFQALFENLVAENFGEDYRPHFSVGRDISMVKFELLKDGEQEWYIEAAPFLRNKKRLYELIHNYQEQISENKVLLAPQTKIDRYASAPQTKIDRYASKTTLENCFTEKHDWQKYIEVMKETNPKLLNSDGKYIGRHRSSKKGPGIGEVAGWIGFLVWKNIIDPNIPREAIAIIFNKHIPNLKLSDSGRNIEFDSTKEPSPILKQLIALAGIHFIA